MISGIWVPLVTPFKQGRVDTNALQTLAEHYLTTDISGFVVLGTTAEAALLSHDERLSVIHAVFDAVGSHLPIMVGIGGIDTYEMQRQIDAFSAWDSAGFLVSAPAYIRPDQKGIEWHFGQIASCTERLITLYDVPHRTGVTIAPQTVEALLRYRNVSAIKACVPESFRDFAKLPLDLLCGTDDAFLACLAEGGVGGILASAHLFPQMLSDVQRLFLTGHGNEANTRFSAILPAIQLLFSAPNPSMIKAGLALMGLIRKETRLPITEASSALTLDLELALSRIDWAACDLSYPVAMTSCDQETTKY
jgi:4-hydroxy-tetrahydrodipicolinate synthase